MENTQLRSTIEPTLIDIYQLLNKNRCFSPQELNPTIYSLIVTLILLRVSDSYLLPPDWKIDFQARLIHLHMQSFPPTSLFRFYCNISIPLVANELFETVIPFANSQDQIGSLPQFSIHIYKIVDEKTKEIKKEIAKQIAEAIHTLADYASYFGEINISHCCSQIEVVEAEPFFYFLQSLATKTNKSAFEAFFYHFKTLRSAPSNLQLEIVEKIQKELYTNQQRAIALFSSPESIRELFQQSAPSLQIATPSNPQNSQKRRFFKNIIL